MAIISQEERSQYLRGFKWAITHTDGHVTSHKLLDYINRRTDRSIQHQVSIIGFLTFIGIIGSVATLGIFLFTKFKKIFLN